jgi:WD40 repeat protein/tetratricopeptide (TPR) repeat protein
MFSTYLDLEVIVGAPTHTIYPVIVRGPGGDAKGDLILPTADATYQGLVARLAGLDTDETILANLGQILFHALFHGSIKEVYTRSQGMLTDGTGLRVKLNIAMSEVAVAALPWEFLYDPDRGPLALLDTPIVRYLPQQAKTPTLQTPLPLKVLLTAAQTQPPVNVARELQAVSTALATLGDFVQVTIEPHLTIPKLQRLLRQDFHVWHFVGHGGFDRDGTTGQLVFEDTSGDIEYVSAPQLGVLLARNSVRLVVLDACHGGQLATQPLRSVAPALIHAQTPAVVAMQLPVPEEATRAFAGEFYQALAEGFPIDACVTEGRKAVMASTGLGRADWGIPVTYTRASDGVLFDLPPTPKPPCPYPGMTPFQPSDARFFYGRDIEIQHILQRLHNQQLLFVIGPSGSGKSSLVRAGLVPRLAESTLFPKDFWLVRELRPGSQPLAALAQAIGGDPAQPALALVALLAAHPLAQRLLLVIDQFEELFSLADIDQQHRFIAALRALRATDQCAQLVLMRADFYASLMTSDLWPIDVSQRMEVAPLRGDALRQAIEQPAKDVGVRLEPGLIERLLADAADEPGTLPLIQETMVLLWNAMPRRLLPISIYERLGGTGQSGLAVAIALKADATLAKLTPAEQGIARRMFVRMVQFGEGRADTRRQQPVAALRAAADDPQRFERTLRVLGDNRLLTFSSDEHGDGQRVDIAHEALIAGWPALQAWLTERRTAEQTRRRLDAKVSEWIHLGRASGGLLDAEELPEAERWLRGPDAADLGFAEELPALVEASRAAIEERERMQEAAHQRELAHAHELTEEQRQRAEEQVVASQRLRRRALWLSGVALLAMLAAILAGVQWRIARQQTAEAERQARIAHVNTLAAESQALLTGNPEAGLLLAIEAVEMTNATDGIALPAAERALRYAIAKTSGIPLVGHQKDILTITFSPNGQTLATGGYDQSIRLWDTRNPTDPPRLLAGNLDIVTALAFRSDGRTLIVCTTTDTGQVSQIRLWDLADLAAAPIALDIHVLVKAMASSPDGHTLAVAGANKTIQLWNLDQVTAPPIVLATGSAITTVAFAPDGRTLAAGTPGGRVLIWTPLSTPPTSPTLQLVAPDTSPISALMFSPDGRTLVTGSQQLEGQDAVARLWQHPSATPLSFTLAYTLTGQTNNVTALAFTPDSHTLAIGSTDAMIRLWQVGDSGGPKPQPGLTSLEGAVSAVAFSPDGSTLATASKNSARLWDLRNSSSEPATLLTPAQPEELVTANGRWMLSKTSTGLVLHDMTNLSAPIPLNLQSEQVAAAISADAHWLVIESDQATRVWDLTAPARPAATLPQVSGSAKPSILAISSGTTNRQLFVALGYDPVGQLWDIDHQTATPELLQGHFTAITAAAFSPDGHFLATASSDKQVRLWDLRQRPISAQVFVGHAATITALAFSADSQRLATAGLDHTIRIWSVAHFNIAPAVLQIADETGFTSITFSLDGARLASVSDDGKLRLWNPAQPTDPPIDLSAPNIQMLAFGADGTRLLGFGHDASVVRWSAQVSDLLTRACSVLSRNLGATAWQEYLGDTAYRLTCPNRPPPTTVINEGQQLAQAGDIERAIAVLRIARAIAPELNPEAYAYRSAATGQIQQDKLREAVVQLNRALVADPSLDVSIQLNALEVAANTLMMRDSQNVREVHTSYMELRLPVGRQQLSATAWSQLCWYGGLWDQAALVLDVCQKAVSMAPDDTAVLAARGLAYALLGRTAAAIDDFQHAVDLAARQEKSDQSAEYQTWLTKLRAGANPFTAEILADLRARKE